MQRRIIVLLLLATLILACQLETLLPSLTDTPEPTARAQPIQTLTQPPVKSIPIYPSPLPISPTPIPAPVFGTATENLRVRGASSTTAPIVDRLNKGDRVEIVGRTAANDWYQIPLSTNPNSRGWVSAEFITLAGALESIPITQPSAVNPVVPTPRPYPYR